MAINNLLGSVKKRVGAGVLGLGLALGSGYVLGSCGEEEYTCEDACKHLIYDCHCTSTPNGYEYCVSVDCKGDGKLNEPWSQEKINYAATVDCEEAC